MAVGDAAEPILAPAIGATARVVVREIVPRYAVSAVIFPHRAPLTLREVRPPAFPVHFAGPVLLKSKLFLCHGLFSGFVVNSSDILAHPEYDTDVAPDS